MASSNQNNQGNNQGNQGKQGTRTQQSGDTSNRGFASMDPERQREIAAEGGRAAHASGNAHEFTSEEARRAGSLSHKNDGSQQSEGGGSGGGNQQSGKQGNQGSQGGQSNQADKGKQESSGTRGGTPEQHAEAGRQSHKKDR